MSDVVNMSINKCSTRAIKSPHKIVAPSNYPGGASEEEEVVATRDVVDCQCSNAIVEVESMFEKVKKKLRQATLLGSPMVSRTSLGDYQKMKTPRKKKTRHSWHQEIA